MCTLILWYIFLTWRNNVFCRFCAINCLALTYCLILATLNSLPTVNISLCSTCNRLLPTKHRGHSRHRWSLLLHAWHKPRRHHIRIHSRHKWWSREGHVAWLKLHTRKVHTRWRHHPGGGMPKGGNLGMPGGMTWPGGIAGKPGGGNGIPTTVVVCPVVPSELVTVADSSSSLRK